MKLVSGDAEHSRRNAAIIRKIEAYTAKATVTKEAALAALNREGMGGWRT